jgi:3-hydroxyacyl-CoA dehydrogenase
MRRVAVPGTGTMGAGTAAVLYAFRGIGEADGGRHWS